MARNAEARGGVALRIEIEDKRCLPTAAKAVPRLMAVVVLPTRLLIGDNQNARSFFSGPVFSGAVLLSL
jgi:hypothetical protein